MINLTITQERPYTMSNGHTDMIKEDLRFTFEKIENAWDIMSACYVSNKHDLHSNKLLFTVEIIKDDKESEEE